MTARISLNHKGRASYTALQSLEDQPQRQLDDARLRVGDTTLGSAGAGNLAERCAGERGIWRPEQRVVQRVKHLGAKLELYSLVNVRPFSNAQIKIRSCGSAECIPSKRSVCPLRRIVHRIESLRGCGGQSTCGERGGIEEIVAGSSIERLRNTRIEILDRCDLIHSHEVLIAGARWARAGSISAQICE